MIGVGGWGVWHQTLLSVGMGGGGRVSDTKLCCQWGRGISDTKLCCLGRGVWHQTLLSVGWAGVWHQTLLSVMNDVVCFMPIQSKVYITARTLVGWYVLAVFLWRFFCFTDSYPPTLPPPHPASPPPPPPHTHTPVPPLVAISKTKMRYG